jgi:hypothetical protein
MFLFNFTCPLRCPRVPPGVRVPQVEYHCPTVRFTTAFTQSHTYLQIIPILSSL